MTPSARRPLPRTAALAALLLAALPLRAQDASPPAPGGDLAPPTPTPPTAAADPSSPAAVPAVVEGPAEVPPPSAPTAEGPPAATAASADSTAVPEPVPGPEATPEPAAPPPPPPPPPVSTIPVGPRRRDAALAGGWVWSRVEADAAVTLYDIRLDATGTWSWRRTVVDPTTGLRGEPDERTGLLWFTRDDTLYLLENANAFEPVLSGAYLIDDRSERLTVQMPEGGPAVFFRYR